MQSPGRLSSLFSLSVTSLLLPCLMSTAVGDVVVVSFTASQVNFGAVPDTPFGLDPVNDNQAIASGWFAYDTNTPDGNSDPDLGDYRHSSPGFFIELSNGVQVTGSNLFVFVVNNNFGNDRFGFQDGSRFAPDGGPMSQDGIADEDVFVSLGVAGLNESTFANDSLPSVFPLVGQFGNGASSPPHTFQLGDQNGRDCYCSLKA